MHNLLSKLFQKRGIQSVDQLSNEEKKQFDGWQEILDEKPITVERIQIFCQAKIGAIESKWGDLSVDSSKKAELIPYHVCYQSLLGIMKTPRNQREELERYLQTLL